MSKDSVRDREHAVVIGSSLAGLFAARVLSDHYAQVTIVERDKVIDRPESRKGQPQTRHLHGLLAHGLQIIKQLFPGLDQQLIEGGAMPVDMGEAIRWYHFGGYKVRFKSGLVGMLMSRPFLEWQIRRRVLQLPNVTLLQERTVRQPHVTDDQSLVIGVEVVNDRGTNEPEIVRADLVVDACGRGSQTPRWLEGMGYAPPPEEEVQVKVGYATRLYRRRPEDLRDAKLLMISPTPPQGKHMAFLFPIEQDRWILTAGGWAGDYPPDDENGYLAFIRNLPAPDIYNIIDDAEPLSDIISHKFPSNLRRYYERLRLFPDGYLVLGDALASFNPIYGQGMTSAAMQACALAEVLQQNTNSQGLWRSFFERVSKVVDMPWQLAVGEDFRYSETKGKKPAFTDLINNYVSKVHTATHQDSVVHAQFLRVMNLMAPAVSLMHPRIAWRVLFNSAGKSNDRSHAQASTRAKA